jgi:hypothetical protein
MIGLFFQCLQLSHSQTYEQRVPCYIFLANQAFISLVIVLSFKKNEWLQNIMAWVLFHELVICFITMWDLEGIVEEMDEGDVFFDHHFIDVYCIMQGMCLLFLFLTF